MTSPLYQTAPNLLPGTVMSNFNNGSPDAVSPAAVAALVLEGEGSPIGTVVAPEGSVYTNTLTGLIYSKSDVGTAGWALVSSSSPLTTKGDIFVHGATDTRLPVGSNGQILSADSGQATGLHWIPAPDLSPYETISDAAATYQTKAVTPILVTVNDGDTFNFSVGQPVLLHLAADAATFTININKPSNGQIVRFAFDKNIAAVTWNSVGVANGYVGAPAAISVGQAFAWVYDASGDKYWPIVY